MLKVEGRLVEKLKTVKDTPTILYEGNYTLPVGLVNNDSILPRPGEGAVSASSQQRQHNGSCFYHGSQPWL